MKPIKRAQFLTIWFALSLVLSLFLSKPRQVAFASLTECRSDPLVVLSDATVLDISADIGTAIYKVTEVHYTLHIPEGLTVVQSVSTPNWPTTIETFTVYDDQPAGQYTTETLIYTQESHTAVTANLLVNLTYTTTSGFSGEVLTITVVEPSE